MLVEQVVTFLQDWISNSSKIKLRHDYLELATLTLLFLGGTLPESIKNATIKDPGAIHHARWMSKTIYTMKIALFRNQLDEIYEEDLDNIVSLAIFLSVFYTEAWLTCTDASAAPSNDLELFKLLLNVENNVLKNPKSWPSHFYSLVSNARKKLENHLWYLSERLVIFSLFSEQVPVSEKKKMTAALLDYTPTTNSAQSMPQSKNFGSKILKDFIGHDSWTMFKLLKVNSSFFNEPVAEWHTNNDYLHGKYVISNVPVVNDAAERALGLATEMNTKQAPKSEDKKEERYKVAKYMREKLKNAATSVETVTKKALKNVKY